MRAAAEGFVYDDMPPYIPHGEIPDPERRAGSTSRSARRVMFCLRADVGEPVSPVDPKTGMAELVAVGIRNSVAATSTPHRATLWFTENRARLISDDLRATSSTT
jgi:glucose/arabinose dehydrogenase